MKILITGSQGTLGKVLKAELRRRGHDVWGCDLQHCDDSQVIRADIAEYRQISRVFKEVKPDLVYNLAAEFGRKNGQEYYEQLWRTNCIGTRHIIDLCIENDALLAHASSSEAYGDVSIHFPEEDPYREVWLEDYVPSFHNEYALTKYTNEKQIEIATKNEGLKAVIFRFFNAYGPGEYYSPYRSVVCLFIYRLLAGLPITIYKNYYRVFMWADDWAKTVANLAENSHLRGVFNIGGREYLSVEELKDKLLKLIPESKSIISYLDSENANVVSKKPDISKSIRLLNHNPNTMLDVGLPITIEWMKKEYGF